MKPFIFTCLGAFVVACGSNPALAPEGPARSADVATPADPASNGNLEVGAVHVEGGDVADATEVATGLADDLRECPGKGAPQTRTELTVSAKIGPQGEVRFAKPEGGIELPGAVLRCITGHVASAQFAPPRGQSPTVIIPIELSYY